MTDETAAFRQRLDETQTVADPHRRFHTIAFQDSGMDFAIQWALGCVRNGGAEIGEVFETASRIIDGDAESWAREWPIIANRVAARGRAAASAGHRVSARECLLRASMYYRAALTSCSPTDPEFLCGYDRSVACFAEAAILAEPQIELIAVPFEGTELPGCFIRGGSDLKPRPTFLAIGGAETFYSDLYFHIGPAAVSRGYNFLTVDLPGQGILPARGQVFRPDTEQPIGAILDYALARPEVDAERLAVYGISAGGYYVPRAAAHDSRIKACIANCGLVDLGRYIAATAIPQQHGISSQQGARLSPFNERMFQIVAWRGGRAMGDLPGFVEQTRTFVFDPRMVTCPVLNVCGEGEYLNPVIRQLSDEFMAGLSHPRTNLVVAGFDDGTGTHCLGENTGLLSAIVFDWLDDLFA